MDERTKAAMLDVLAEAKARENLVEFSKRMDPKWLPARHLVLIAEHLEALERREIRKLAIMMPPRHGKTRLVSQLATAWYIGRHPDHDVILASYGSDLADDNSRAVRDLVLDPMYPFPNAELRKDSQAVGRWQMRSGGVLKTGSPESGVNGFGYHWGCADDLIKDRKAADSPSVRADTAAWYGDVFNTRRAPGAVQLIVGTRWRTDDIIAEVTSQDGWTILRLPLSSEGEGDALARPAGAWLWPERIGPDDVPSVERGEISSRSFAALYQQLPVPQEGNLIKTAWFENRYDEPPDNLTHIELGLDSAAKTGVSNDFSVIATIGVSKNEFFVLNIERRKVEFPDLLRMTVAANERSKPRTIFVEDTSSGVALIQALMAESHLPIKAVKAILSKVARVEGVTGLMEAGKVRLPREAPWLVDLERELFSFPNEKHDDCVDALVLVLSQHVAKQPTWRCFTWGPNPGDNSDPFEDDEGGYGLAPDYGGVSNAIRGIFGGGS